MATCFICNVELHEGNTYPSMFSRGDHKCRSCVLEKERRKNPTRMYVNGKYISFKHPLHKPGRYKTFNDAAFEGTYKPDSIKEGYVYVITNPAWPEWVKIGMAIDADDRCNGYQTGSPFRDYVLEHVMVTNNRRAAETQAHTAAAKIAEEQRGEWFKLSVEEAKNILNTCSVIVEPEAKQKEQKQSAAQDLFTYAQVRA